MNTILKRASWLEVCDPEVLVKEPLVSIHMITYNHEKYLAEALDSLVGQETQYPYEIVIGEDCSPDGTRSIALDYQRRYPDRIRVLYSETNVGMLPNSDRVTDSCRGKYIAPCEGDDYWHEPRKLQLQVDFLESNPDYVMVYGAFNVRNGQQITAPDLSVERWPSGAIFEALLAYCFIATCTVCLRMDIIREFRHSRFNRHDNPMGDYPCWLYASQRGSIKYMNTALATYRRVKGSATNSGYKASLRILQSSRKVANEFVGAYGCSAQGVKAMEISGNLQAMAASSLAGDRELFKKEFLWFRQNNPSWEQDWTNRGRRLLLKFRVGWVLRLRLWLRSKTGNLLVRD